jgi:hypothetical protein
MPAGGIQQKTHSIRISRILNTLNMFLLAASGLRYDGYMSDRWCRRLAILLLLVQPAVAVAQNRPGCLKPDEVNAEAVVRTGVDIREVLKACARRNFAAAGDTAAEALANFRSFDDAYAAKIQSELEIRRLALQRNYPDRKAVERQMDGAIISVYQGREMSDGECIAAMRVMDQIEAEGWQAFQRQVEITRRYIEPNVVPCSAPK